MNASQIPLKVPWKISMAMPSPISAYEMTRPPAAASRVALRRSPFQRQSPARSIRPPSSGSAGSRLKASRSRLMNPSHAHTALTGSGRPGRKATPTKPAPRPSDTSGPATAMRNSAPGDGNMPAKRATPPNSQSVMPSMAMPSRRACTAWPSSCRRIEAKKASAATTAMVK